MRSRGARRLLAGVSAALGVTGLAASAVMSASPPREAGTGHVVVAVPAPVAPVRPKPVVRHLPVPSLIATLEATTPYASRPGGPAVGTMPATNPFGGVTVLAVVGGSAASGWLHVELPIRPNGSTGWIRSAGVSLSETTYRVVVSTEKLTVSVYEGDRLLLATPSAVGKPSTPTPLGRTYLWELIRPDDPYGAYGPYIFGLAWFSNAYAIFNGGDAQIGLHGTDETWSIGQPVSHGCIRIGNDMITRLSKMLPLGTPVTID